MRNPASPHTDRRTHVRALRLSLHARPVGPGQAWPHALVSRIDAMFVCTLVRVFRFGVGLCVLAFARAHRFIPSPHFVYTYYVLILQTNDLV